jgi:MscS family membrane protein
MAFLGLDQLQWQEIGVSALILVSVVLLGRLLIRRILLPILKRLIGRTETKIDDILLEALTGPAYWLLLIFVAQYAISRLDFLNGKFQLQLEDAYFVLYLGIFFVLVWRVISDISSWIATDFGDGREAALGKQLMPFISRVSLIIITIITGIILLGHFNVEVSGLVATLGIGSLAIALAAQEALSDTIAGFIIMIDRPYRIGDRIELLEMGTWGDVMDIGLRSTRIRTRDNRMAIIPNSVIGKSLVVNHSYPDETYRLEIEIGVAYGTDLEQARKVLIDAVSQVEGVKPDLPVEALFLKFGESSLIFRVRWWLDSYVETRRMFDRVNTSMYQALSKAGIQLPFPQRVVHHKVDDEQGNRLAEILQKKK